MNIKINVVILFILCNVWAKAQERQLQMKPIALDAGVYNYNKAKKKAYKIYYGEEAEAKFTKVLMHSKRLQNSGLFGQHIKQENDSIVFSRENNAYEYCPELNYVIETGGHGFAFIYNLKTLEELFVNPSSYIYSPSGKYRFGTFENDGMYYYLEIKENGKYVPYLLFIGSKGDMEGVYWADNETIYYLKEKQSPNRPKYKVGYSTKFYDIKTTNKK